MTAKGGWSVDDWARRSGSNAMGQEELAGLSVAAVEPSQLLLLCYCNCNWQLQLATATATATGNCDRNRNYNGH
jgi:hypothetical protein